MGSLSANPIFSILLQFSTAQEEGNALQILHFEIFTQHLGTSFPIADWSKASAWRENKT